MSGGPTDEAAEGTAYTFRPSVLGAPREFRLVGDGLDWAVARKSGHIRFSDVRRLRLSYRPTSMQSHRFMTELWAQGAPKLEILSSSWKSMVEQQRLDQPYTAFVIELHRRIALAAPPARYEQGSNPLLYWPGLFVFTSLMLALAVLVVRALQADTKAGAAFVGVFLLLLLWQGGNFFRRNRPGAYRPETPPAELLPKG
ncbi:MAG TPA: hypothetical protein VFC45_00345 [Pseudolabrys sp.]|nr:hypothetical protein [Pseudolabrys sp.]